MKPTSSALVLLFALLSPPGTMAQAPAVNADGIEEFQQAFEQAVRSWDIVEWAALLHEDAVMMTPFGQTIEGREAFRRYWERAWEGRAGSGPNPLRLELRETLIEGDLATVRLAYGPEGGETVGDYVWILTRSADGSWRLEWWIFTRRPPDAPQRS